MKLGSRAFCAASAQRLIPPPCHPLSALICSYLLEAGCDVGNGGDVWGGGAEAGLW